MNHLPADSESIVRQFFEGERSALDPLHMRSGDRGGVFRLPLATGTAVIKAWKIRNLKERLKSVLHVSNGRREWRMHRMVYQAGIQTPAPLWHRRLTVAGGQSYELMALEDLGETERGLPYLKRMIKSGDNGAATVFEEAVIDITAKLLDFCIIDVDNQINNFLVNSSGHIARIDFECARKRKSGMFRRLEYVTMLERLIRSHLHATYPESGRTNHFILQLTKKLHISPPTLQRVLGMTAIELRREKEKTGINYTFKVD